MSTPKPQPLTPIQVMRLARIADAIDLKQFVPTDKIGNPKPTARPRKERSEPVRNPAFREHEGLKALQRTLHTQSK